MKYIAGLCYFHPPHHTLETVFHVAVEQQKCGLLHVSKVLSLICIVMCILCGVHVHQCSHWIVGAKQIYPIDNLTTVVLQTWRGLMLDSFGGSH